MAESSEQLELFATLPKGLPEYTIRESSRARHVSIKVSVKKEIEVVVPRGFDSKRVPELLQKRRSWLWQTVQRLEEQTAGLGPHHFEDQPSKIEVRSRDETWQILYKSTAARGLELTQPSPYTLLVRGDIENTGACRDLLGQWLTRKARAEFAPWLRELSFDINLPFNRISIRGQKTRWASCSSQKNISLNYKLLFLPPELVDYVFVHELCHTIHMNHSRAFWQLVQEKQPDYEPYRYQIKEGWRYVPQWVE